MRKFLFWPYQLYAWLIFLPLAVLITLAAGWLVVLVSWLVSPRFASRYFASTRAHAGLSRRGWPCGPD
ncbi:MAG TPA: hypothetical protein VK830_02775, partial [Xanthomonadales bacterium]|nr:hypothetical protein [Xanthomonadales bacterium]